jgi:DNA (cytosine-5)-methyltransferase 1
VEKESVFEPFCGCGGLGTGFSKFFWVAYAIDIKRCCVETYRSNHPETAVQLRDVRDITGCQHDFDGVVGVIGGPPCQSFSRLNLRKRAGDPRSSLLEEFVRLVGEIQPRFFLLENVPTVPAEKKKSVIRIGKSLDYSVTSAILNAADYGAAQNRRRWIVVGLRGGAWGPPAKRRPRTVRQAFSTLGQNWGFMRSTPETLQRLAKTVPRTWIALTGGFKNAIRLSWDEPSPAVVNLKKVYMVHPSEDRNITLAEAAALQGFPSRYIWHGTESEIAQMLADAVPVEFAEALASSLVQDGR